MSICYMKQQPVKFHCVESILWSSIQLMPYSFDLLNAYSIQQTHYTHTHTYTNRSNANNKRILPRFTFCHHGMLLIIQSMFCVVYVKERRGCFRLLIYMCMAVWKCKRIGERKKRWKMRAHPDVVIKLHTEHCLDAFDVEVNMLLIACFHFCIGIN